MLIIALKFIATLCASKGQTSNGLQDVNFSHKHASVLIVPHQFAIVKAV